MTRDPSNGYERVAADFIAARSGTGSEIIKKWTKSLPSKASVLDVGAGHGWPITPILLTAGLEVSAIDASPSLVAAYRKSFPDIPIACETVEASDFFGKTYDAVLSVGLMFLLKEDEQRRLIKKIAKSLKPNGKFLFSAPKQIGTWKDVLTGETSVSLGEEVYKAILSKTGFSMRSGHIDSGGSHYYDAEKI